MSHDQRGDTDEVELVAIINSFNRRQLLEEALTSLTAALRKASFKWAIIVFEAGSTDGSKEFLAAWREQHPTDNLNVISPVGETASFSDGLNAAVARAIAQFPKVRWLFLYETDNVLLNVQPLERAVSLLTIEPQLGAAGFTVKQHDGRFFGYGMRFPGLFSFALGQNLAAAWGLHAPNSSPWQKVDNIRWKTCDIVFTSPLLVRRQAWEQTDGFDAVQFPFSDSDLDWAWRCSRLGWKMAVISDENVIHDNRKQLSAWSAARVLDFHRNRFRLLKRHRGRLVALLKPLLFLRHLLETILLAVRSNDPASGEKLAKRKQMMRTVWTNYS